MMKISLLGAMLLVTCFSVGTSFAQSPTNEEAAALYTAQKWEEAEQAYAAITAREPQNPRGWIRLGFTRYNQSKYDEAVEAWMKVEELGFAPAYNRGNLAALYAKQGKADEAFSWLDKALAAGFANANMLETDEDFAPIRDDARFDDYLMRAKKKAQPCVYSDVHRQFDFWAGDWDVYNPQDQLVGTNSIQKMANECVLVEHWLGASGGNGMSVNYYDPGKQKWVQHWVGGTGYTVEIEGGLDDEGSMVLVGSIIQMDGSSKPFRGKWTLLDDGRVRQFFEQSEDDGKTWKPWFEGFYQRQSDQ